MAIDEITKPFLDFEKQHENEIEQFLAKIGNDPFSSEFEEFYWDQIADLKSFLGEKAANAVGDENEADDAIELAWTWAASNISNNDDRGLVAIIWLNGDFEAGTKMILEKLGKKHPPRQRY